MPRSPTGSPARASVLVADEVWIATGLLHRGQPDREDFSVQEIVARAVREGLHVPTRASIYVHAVQHCVANRPPNPGRCCMLLETSKGRRRLWRSGDPVHPGRTGGRHLPDRQRLPARYGKLLDWYETDYAPQVAARHPLDAILELSGLGKKIWKGIDPDEYVRQLREGWE